MTAIPAERSSALDAAEIEAFLRFEARLLVWFRADSHNDKPIDISVLDSFAAVQLILSVEQAFDIQVLEKFAGYKAPSFAALAQFVVDNADPPLEALS